MPLTLAEWQAALKAYTEWKEASHQLSEILQSQRYTLNENELIVWVPDSSFASMYVRQVGILQDFLCKYLGREEIRVRTEVRPEAFPKLAPPQTFEERWQQLCQLNPLAEELRRRAQGKPLPQDV
ncbi:MAG: hypothetical protein NZ958_01200 [Bacteroidia bacterium]|nr:hypothetical protein [Bacteroidia bacterium]MDW8089280.1 hypothetical protein [Bacteroidia bacterium]